MPINFRTPETRELRPRITVLGVGGAGGNAVNNMIASRLEGVDFVVANTDAQSIAQSKAERKIQMGVRVTEGLGAGAQPDIGRAGAEESLEEILEQLSGAHMVFITAGMGGGTGTGAAPVIARAVRELGILTVGVVTKPFAFEGDKRMRIAERGIQELQNYVHTLIVIPNQNLFRVANDRTTFAQAFTMADEVLHCGVRGVTDLIVMPGLINLDFADIKSVISEMGKAMMGTGEAEGEDRAIKAADSAICNPLLEDVSMKGARGVLINITGGPDLMLFEVEQAANRVRAEVDPDANIIFGNTILDDMEGRIRVSVVATGIDAEEMRKLPENVERLRLGAKTPPQPLRHEPVRPAAAAAPAYTPVSNPVHRQVEALAQELRAEAPPTVAMPVSMVSESAMLSDVQSTASHQEIAEPVVLRAASVEIKPEPVRVAAESEKRGMFGWGWKKPVERSEPVAATVRPVVETFRSPSSQQETSATQSSLTGSNDLFPEQPEEKFEIPAFLRRQTN